MKESEFKVTRAEIVTRGLRCCCPNCGNRGLLASWFRLNSACQSCGMDLARSAGLSFGTTSIGYVAAIIVVIIPLCFLVGFKVLSVKAGVLLGIFGSFGFIILLYPAMLCWLVMAYHAAMPSELPANAGQGGTADRSLGS